MVCTFLMRKRLLLIIFIIFLNPSLPDQIHFPSYLRGPVTLRYSPSSLLPSASPSPSRFPPKARSCVIATSLRSYYLNTIVSLVPQSRRLQCNLRLAPDDPSQKTIMSLSTCRPPSTLPRPLPPLTRQKPLSRGKSHTHSHTRDTPPRPFTSPSIIPPRKTPLQPQLSA
jgi:hypothetical protein